MKILEDGQKFLDEQNAREVEILEEHGAACYCCKTIEGACDDDAGKEGRQFFTTTELMNMRSI